MGGDQGDETDVVQIHRCRKGRNAISSSYINNNVTPTRVCMCGACARAFLQVENVEVVPPNHIKFDFLGKDSIRYENTVAVEAPVYKAVEAFTRTDARGKSKKCSTLLVIHARLLSPSPPPPSHTPL